ncbi:helix-turn-helix domain-containing protein [Schnuerera ultunensis]|uniref:Insertion element IS150 protein InsJ-like helix-turn-helix domain-containing protein n=1 Tax=[Clostridium] ultunense Esp TaxID=1288971 RepID=A0A1M4PLW6_9FIRM|nr:conserved protein of unknown function [[Clostridium] ultunense Esp]
MSKYSFEFKLKVVKEYMKGETGGYKSVAKKYDVINHGLIRYWVNDYKKYGEEGLKIKSTKTFYSGEFKLRVLQYRQFQVTAPTVNFTTDALDDALKKLPKKHKLEKKHKLTIHSDQGFHYQHEQWVKRLKNRNIEQSMSRRGNCIDNSPRKISLGY